MSTKGFRFRLESLLHLRRVKEDLARHELAAAHREVAAQNGRLAGLLREERDSKDALRRIGRDGVDLVQVRLHGDYLAALERRVRREFEKLQELSRVETEKRRALTKAMKDVRILERLRGRQEQAHRLGQDREEQKVLDEVAQNQRQAAGA